MKNKNHRSQYVALLCFALLVTILISCKTYFVVADIDTRTANDKTIAVLPFEMNFTGVKPEKLTDEDLLTIEEAESKAFMFIDGSERRDLMVNSV